jgi:EAL domain-containing protein (putative c-di-GMP-specific phosphodiesterase class I)
VHLDRQTVRNQATIGITLFPDDAQGSEELLRQSDSALRQGKRGGGNQWVFYREALIHEAANRVVVGGRLRQAIASGEIQVAYQPIVSLADEAVIGYEALARWQHPQRGWISPGEFIPVAEQNGLIEDLAEIVLADACLAIAKADDPHSLFIAVNISPLQIHRPDIVKTLRDECDAVGIPPEQLVVEITEQAVLDLDKTTLSRLDAIRQAGISVAIDDFGTGYASLSYLKHLPADRIKVDRQFVTDVDRDPGNQAILNATLTLAGAFGLTLTAEGVETREEAEALRALGYTTAQGFFFGKPRVADAAHSDR